MGISLKVEVGAGNVSDMLEDCYQLGKQLHIAIQFEANDSKWQVFAHWESAMQVTKEGQMIAWKRESNRNWTKRKENA